MTSNPRFHLLSDDLVEDHSTGLVWARDAGLFEFPLAWSEGLAAIADLNRVARFGRTDWRMPNRNELRSLLDHGEKRPALPAGHPFRRVFSGWHWTSTTAAIAPAYAWYVHLEGARMFYGNKRDFYWLWPVCGSSAVLPRTGQMGCFDDQGGGIDCRGTGQDGELRAGRAWPQSRFSLEEDGVLDRLTGLIWQQQACLDCAADDWPTAMAAVADLVQRSVRPWRLPTIRELESLIDASRHRPALSADHLFTGVCDTYWSSTSSGFDSDWAFALYLTKGAIGVGYKPSTGFSVWPVMSGHRLVTGVSLTPWGETP
jgi:hypothetical protein